MRLPLNGLRASGRVCLLLHNSIRSGDESLDFDIGRRGQSNGFVVQIIKRLKRFKAGKKRFASSGYLILDFNG